MSSTLLQKAQQALNEKITKVLPENIKNGITMFGVTGSYTGGGGSEIIEFGSRNVVAVDFSALAIALEQQVSAADKARPIVRNSSGFDACLQVSAIYNKLDNTIGNLYTFGIGVDNGYGLYIVCGDSACEQIYEGDSSTARYFAQGMTLQDLITVFGLIGTKTAVLPLDVVGDCILYGISVGKLFFDDNGFASTVYNIPSNVFTFSISRLNEHIDENDYLTINWDTVADIIRDNCTAEELTQYVNPVGSGYNPCLILSDGCEFVMGTTVYENSKLFASITSSDWLGLCVGSNEWTEELSPTPIFQPDTEHEIPEECTVSDLCNMLSSAGEMVHKCFEDQADMEFYFSQPIVELRLVGQTLDKTILVDTTQYDLISVNHCY